MPCAEPAPFYYTTEILSLLLRQWAAPFCSSFRPTSELFKISWHMWNIDKQWIKHWSLSNLVQNTSIDPPDNDALNNNGRDAKDAQDYTVTPPSLSENLSPTCFSVVLAMTFVCAFSITTWITENALVLIKSHMTYKWLKYLPRHKSE